MKKLLLSFVCIFPFTTYASAFTAEELETIKQLTTAAVPAALAEAEKKCSPAAYKKALQAFLEQPNIHVNSKDADGHNTLERIIAHCSNNEMIVVAQGHGAQLQDDKVRNAHLLSQAINKAIEKQDIPLLQTLCAKAKKTLKPIVNKGQLIIECNASDLDATFIELFEQEDFSTICNLTSNFVENCPNINSLVTRILKTSDLSKIRRFKAALDIDGSYTVKNNIYELLTNHYLSSWRRYQEFCTKTNGISTPAVQEMANNLKQEYSHVETLREIFKLRESYRSIDRWA